MFTWRYLIVILEYVCWKEYQFLRRPSSYDGQRVVAQLRGTTTLYPDLLMCVHKIVSCASDTTSAELQWVSEIQIAVQEQPANRTMYDAGPSHKNFAGPANEKNSK